MTSQNLFNQCDQLVTSYPAGTCKLETGYPFAGRGFFPVVSGSFHSGCLNTPIAPRKLLFVGQDWGCEANLPALDSDKDADIKSGTGKILLDLLIEAEIPQEDCFFTNALFGVRDGGINTGPSPGWNDSNFVDQCIEAMKKQISTVCPRGIICLGREAPKLLERLMSECGNWISANSFKTIDRNGHSVMSVKSLPGVIITAILLHPSFRRANARHRNYSGSEKNEAELKILADVWDVVKRKPYP